MRANVRERQRAAHANPRRLLRGRRRYSKSNLLGSTASKGRCRRHTNGHARSGVHVQQHGRHGQRDRRGQRDPGPWPVQTWKPQSSPDLIRQRSRDRRRRPARLSPDCASTTHNVDSRSFGLSLREVKTEYPKRGAWTKQATDLFVSSSSTSARNINKCSESKRKKNPVCVFVAHPQIGAAKLKKIAATAAARRDR
jgi:hypothetical protein